ncbi:DUF2322 family protein [Ottowia sp.]|uniref:DUF2322 family protein n=1 Tax=Ottowia sp. TaxID=1898956 RepID=UPI002B9E6389|nr:DUF2322 family protein [Ottowia sp.]HRN76341.1 DUF2322 family protein [Ottowia sp.]HRQ01862.1 DUF2322 family protein [Ottowia sp.]
MNFAETLASLPPIGHLRGLDIIDAQGAVVRHIPAEPGKLGSLRVYNALAERFGGRLSAEAVAQGLVWFAEHVADARAHPGSHPNIDLLLCQPEAHSGWRLVPLPA